MRRLILIAALLSFAIPAESLAQESPRDPAPAASVTSGGEDNQPSPLDKLVATYFTADQSGARRDALKQIKGLPDVIFNDVADALRRAPLWQKQTPGMAHDTLAMPAERKRDGREVQLAVRVPQGYDPARAYGLILGIPDTQQDADKFVGFLAALLGERKDAYVVVVATDLAGAWLGDDQAAAGDPLVLLMELKHRYHLDSDRFHLLGYGAGGQAACSLALLQSDQFASVMVLAGACIPDMGAEAIDFFLANLGNLPTTVVYGARDAEIVKKSTSEEITGGVAGWNRYVASRAKKLGIPLRAIELQGAKRDGIVPPAQVLDQFLGARRPVAPHGVAHVFRYPAQGSAHWLRQTRYDGEPWTAQQIVISPGENESSVAAVTTVLREKLAYVGGEIADQTIRITTQRCARIDVLLHDELVDLDRDVVIFVDGTRRFQGRLERRIATLLEEADRTWDFQRPIAARLRVSRAGRAIQH